MRNNPLFVVLCTFTLAFSSGSCVESSLEPNTDAKARLSAVTSSDAGTNTDTDASMPVNGCGGGDGSLANPYQLCDCMGLQAIQSDLSAFYRLAADIDCAGFDAGDGKGFDPIGTNPAPFTGGLLGDGHVISNLTIARPNQDRVGLFGVTNNAIIVRLGLDNASVEGRQRVGGIIGWQRGGLFYEAFVKGWVKGDQYVGGLVGRVQDGTVLNSYSHATLVCTKWDNKPNKTNSSCGLLVGGVVQAITVDSYAAGLAASQHGLSGGGGPDTQITSYFDCELTGGCGNTHDEGRDTDTLQDEAFFLAEDWDLTTVWGFDGVHTYPCLRWEASCSGGPVCETDDTSCDGIDDDCDGVVDEDFVSTSSECGVGACLASGAVLCISGSEEDDCIPGTPATNDTICDGIDNDCDGGIDEDYVSTNTICGVGACGATGTTSCTAGTESDSCIPGISATNDTSCDGIDNDCNGGIDDGYIPSATICGVGACGAIGTMSCTMGTETDSCTPSAPATQDATCDGIDDDCDGAIDEDCCLPTDCTTEAADCGVIEDGCASSIDCGSCGSGDTCGGGGSPNVCGKPLPPDPQDIAPSGPASGFGTFLERYSFLVDTQSPIQTGLDPDVLSQKTASGIRGRVIGTDDSPISGVRVSFHGRPEFGETLTRADGRYDLVFNGDGHTVLVFESTGYLPVHRRVDPEWSHFGILVDVVLTAASTVTEYIDFSGATDPKTATSETRTDDDGTRHITAFFPSGVTAFTQQDGQSVPIDGGTLRMTEFTVGENGPQSHARRPS